MVIVIVIDEIAAKHETFRANCFVIKKRFQK